MSNKKETKVAYNLLKRYSVFSVKNITSVNNWIFKYDMELSITQLVLWYAICLTEECVYAETFQ